MIIQKYKSVVAFLFIAIGTSLQIISIAVVQNRMYLNDTTVIFIVVGLVIIVWLLAECLSTEIAWKVIKERKVSEYYNEIVTGNLNENQLREKWCDLYYVMHKGTSIDYGKIDRKKLEDSILKSI